MENRGRGRGFSVAWSRRVERLGLDSQASSISDLDNRVLEALLRLLLVLSTLLLNCAMVTLYTKALSLASVAAEASLINTASNLCFTAVFSFVIFRETFSYQWLLGMVLVISGVSLSMTDDHGLQEVKKTD